jgi:hypothetical protein
MPIQLEFAEQRGSQPPWIIATHIGAIPRVELFGRVRAASGLSSLENDDALPGLGEQGRGGQPVCPGAYYGGVVGGHG